MTSSSDLRQLCIVIGSAKCGTSALAGWLNQDDAFVEGHVKETRFFTDMRNQTWAGPGTDNFAESIPANRNAYVANFADLGPQSWAVDASTDYIWWPGTAEQIDAFAQEAGVDVRLIAMVRDPIDRMVSEYNHTLARGMETLTFSEALAAEEERRNAGWHPLFYHKRRSKISADLTRFRQVFGERLLILDYGVLSQPAELSELLATRLGLPKVAPLATERRNEDRMARNAAATKVLQSGALRTVARKVVPTGLRKKVWDMMHAPTRTLTTVTSEERATARDLMADEIESCRKDPGIPTARWKSIR